MSDLLTVRYPSGAKEFRMSDTAPEVGDVLERNGDDWVVEEVVETKRGTQVILRRGLMTEGNPDDAKRG
jgi:hypothetical protein